MHDLRKEVAYGKEERHYRLRNYIHRNTENYPTTNWDRLHGFLELTMETVWCH